MNTKGDLRQDLTNRILAYLESGTIPWRKAWSSASSRPINAKSQKPYAGVNSLILGMSMYENAHYSSDPRFITEIQANGLGMKIRTGQQPAAHIIRMVEVDRRKAEKDSTGEVVAEENGKCLIMRTYAVFHASQLESELPTLAKPAVSIAPVAAVGAIVNAMKGTGLKIAEGPFEPVFMPKLDLIRMPPMASFKGSDADDVAANFYGTLMHEMSHAVGAPKRLRRFGLSKLSLQERAIEEMTAEWAAAMMCSGIKGIKLGEDHIQQHSAYLSSWMQALKEDKGAIFRAAAAAQRTCDYLDNLVVPVVASEAAATAALAANKPVIEPAIPIRRVNRGFGSR